MTAQELAQVHALLAEMDNSASQALWNIGAALIGAIAGGVATYLVTRYLRKRDVTFALYEELNGEDMSNVRDAAYRRFLELDSDDLQAASDDPMNNIENISIWRIYRFYTKLELLRAKGELRDELLSGLFGKLYLWWWHVLLEPGYRKTTWDGIGPLQSLYSAMKKMEDEGNTDEWRSWEKHAQEERARMLKVREKHKSQQAGRDAGQNVLVSITIPAAPDKAVAVVQ